MTPSVGAKVIAFSTITSKSVEEQARIYVAGHRGLVGSAIARALTARGQENFILRASEELDLRSQAAVQPFYTNTRPEYVFLAAVRVGGILANDRNPADFIYGNLMIQANLIHGAFEAGVKKLLFLGSTCIYPKLAPQPLKEEYLLSGPLEPTNEWYALAKITGIKLCQAYRRQHGCRFISAMPTNLYGPGDNFDLQTSHVLPALVREFHEAKTKGAPQVELWGTRRARREFCHVDDCAAACLHLMDVYEDSQIITIGVGTDLTIGELAEAVRRVVGFQGDVSFDKSRPDGTPRKLVDVARIFSLGWRPAISLEEGIRATYQWHTEQLDD